MIITMTGHERDLALKIPGLDAVLRRKLDVALLNAGRLTLDLRRGERDTLQRGARLALHRSRNPKTRRALIRLLDRLSSDSAPAPDDLNRSAGPPFGAFLDRIVRGTPGWQDMSLKEQADAVCAAHRQDGPRMVEGILRAMVQRANRQPRPEFHGLSPNQVSALIHQEWDAGTPGVRVHDDLPANLVSRVPMLRYTRVFLNALEENDGTSATARGNLNRKFVSRMVDEMGLPRWYVFQLRTWYKVLNERNVWLVELVHVMVEAAGLIRCDGKRIVVTEKGRRLLTTERHGQLFAELFLARFRTRDMACWDRFPEMPGFQHSLGYSLYRLHCLGGERWHDAAEQAEPLILPSVAEQLPVFYDLDFRWAMVQSRLLRPLEEYGLIELKREIPGGVDDPFPPAQAFRITPLFDRFLDFDLG